MRHKSVRSARAHRANTISSVVVIASLAPRACDAISNIWREATTFGIVGTLPFTVDNGCYSLLAFGLLRTGDGPTSPRPSGSL
jgi:hypothetical protein